MGRKNKVLVEKISNKEFIDAIKYCKKQKVRFAVSTAFKDGGVGAIPLADEILAIEKEEKYKKLYDVKLPIEDKISRIVKDIFKASKINYSEQAQSIIDSLKEQPE